MRRSTFYKTSYLNEEVNRTEPSPSVSVSWINMFCTIDARLTEVERENAILSASSASASKTAKNFVAEILKKIAELFNKETHRLEKYSLILSSLVLGAIL
jgi:hypothetical protein